MNEIRSLLAAARRRLEWTRYLGRLHVVAFVAAIIGLLLVNIERIGPQLFVPWTWVAPGLLGLSVIIAWAWWLRGRPQELHVAIEVDERLDLREKFSTALHCQGRDDSFAQAALQDAVQTAVRPQTRELLQRRFTILPPARWYLSPLVVFLAFMLSFIAPLDLFATDEVAGVDPDQAVQLVNEEVDLVIDQIKQETGDELAPQIEEIFDELSEPGMMPDEFSKEEDIKREAIRNLSELNKKLEELIDGEKGKTGEAIEKKLKQLQPPSDGLAKELTESLANADFDAAQDALKAMMDQMEAGELNEEQKKELAKQLEDLAEQLEELAKQQGQMEQALKEAGMDPQLAKNPQALQQAIQNNQNLNQQQKQQLQQMAQGQQAAQQMMQGLGQACQAMAQAMQGQQGAQQAGNQMAQQLGQMEQLQQMLQQAQAAMKACNGQCQGLGNGLAMQQAMQMWDKQGGGMGNRGQGRGGKAPLAPTPHRSSIEKAEVNTVAGDVIGKTKVDAPQWVGESNRKTTLVKVEEILDTYDEAITEEQLPMKYHKSQQHYFGELKKQVETIRKAAEQAESGGEESSDSNDEGGSDRGSGDDSSGEAG